MKRLLMLLLENTTHMNPVTVALLAQAVCVSIAAFTVAFAPAPDVARLRAASATAVCVGPLIASLLALLARPRWLALHLLFACALAVAAAWGAAQVVCDPLQQVRAVWYRPHGHALGLPNLAESLVFLAAEEEEECGGDGAPIGRATVATAAAAWLLALVAESAFVVKERPGLVALGACTALSVWALVVLNAYAWDWRPVYTLLGTIAACAYVGAGFQKKTPSATVDEALAALWLPLPRALLSLVGSFLLLYDDEDDEDAAPDDAASSIKAPAKLGLHNNKNNKNNIDRFGQNVHAAPAAFLLGIQQQQQQQPPPAAALQPRALRSLPPA